MLGDPWHCEMLAIYMCPSHQLPKLNTSPTNPTRFPSMELSTSIERLPSELLIDIAANLQQQDFKKLIVLNKQVRDMIIKNAAGIINRIIIKRYPEAAQLLDCQTVDAWLVPHLPIILGVEKSFDELRQSADSYHCLCGSSHFLLGGSSRIRLSSPGPQLLLFLEKHAADVVLWSSLRTYTDYLNDNENTHWPDARNYFRHTAGTGAGRGDLYFAQAALEFLKILHCEKSEGKALRRELAWYLLQNGRPVQAL
ncbi:hypothetical protein BJ878DRAFT_75193 [Calycina marina]|uniref:F-box domain-containing protein n=1 Tax=Calycina marina TaxID=1763456 RepID=A0A9P7Z2T7_9HELO|nr:hypothetical protein BJ878DRAFT_75193 [Calycina marina]